jgi:hypothetical protein
MMDHDSFSIHIGGHYESRQDFSEKAREFIATAVSDRVKIPLPDFRVALMGEWRSVGETRSLRKDFDGDVVIDRIMDPDFGFEWRGDISVLSTGEDDDSPCEAFQGKIHMLVIE